MIPALPVPASSRACRSHRCCACLEGSAVLVGAGEPAKRPAQAKRISSATPCSATPQTAAPAHSR
ncbi:hypothetical protein GEV39_06935 [Pseudomonas sp. NY5710]|nr:hypothetical protein GEV39_06935 [Pseudomonas sp. NY5710]